MSSYQTISIPKSSLIGNNLFTINLWLPLISKYKATNLSASVGNYNPNTGEVLFTLNLKTDKGEKTVFSQYVRTDMILSQEASFTDDLSSTTSRGYERSNK